MRKPVQVVVALLVAVPPSAGAAGFAVSDAPPAVAPVEAVGGPVEWGNARLFPVALALAQEQARIDAAARADDLSRLKPGADGSVDLALSTLIDITLRNNLDLIVRSYDQALSVEAVNASESIFDPLLRFTVDFLSSTSPTTASLAGARVLTQKQANWNGSIGALTPYGGQALVGWDNGRNKTNSSFSTLNPSYQSNLQLGFEQPLLRDFGKSVTRREIDIALNQEQSARENFRRQVMNKVTETVSAYWDLYGRWQQLGVRKQALELAQDLLRINNTRVEVGTMAPLDVTTAEAEVARQEQLLILSEAELRDAADQVLQLMNAPVGSPLWNAAIRPVDRPEVGSGEVDVDAAIADALAARPEIRQAELALANDAIRLDFAKNQKKPGLALQASYGIAGIGGTEIVRSGFGDDDAVVETIPGGYGDALDTMFSFDYDTWRIGAVIDFPLFNQLADANHASALLRQAQDQATVDVLKQAIAVETRRVARNLLTARKEIDATAATRRLQEKRLDAEQKKFEHGLSTNYEVQIAQEDLTDARSAEVLAITGYRRALVALENAKGTVLDVHGVRIHE